jgi:hypothetical protein
MRFSIKLLTFSLVANSSLYYSADWAMAEPTNAPAESAKTAVGIASRDGISLSGTDVLVTRNGISEKLTKPMTLSGGVKVKPDGTMVGTDGSEVMLRPEQLLTFEGQLVNIPVSRTNPAIPTVTGQ